MEKKKQGSETAMFGAGCFWDVQAEFDKLSGLIKTEAGYSGGHPENPSYHEVCTDGTGHAEVVRIEYNPKKIKYEDLLKKFWEIHDPTQKNRQGPDIGSQYRSVIFYFDDQQKKIAQESMKEEQKRIGKKIETEIVKAGHFYKAEEYHQRYLMKRGLASCPVHL